jgi:uncharacterized membrane protein YkvA (DUF1232 family)
MTGPDRPSGADEAPAPDPFPWDGFGALVRRTPRYLKLAWLLAGEPAVPRSRRAAVVAAAAYLASPVDLVPGIIPVVGQLDDLAITMLALRAALRSLDEPTRTRVLAEAELGRDDLDADITTIGLAAGWLLRRGARLTIRLVRLAALAALAAGRVGLRVGASAGRVAARGGLVVARRGAGGAKAVGQAGIGATASIAGRTGRVTGRGLGSLRRAMPKPSRPRSPEDPPAPA